MTTDPVFARESWESATPDIAPMLPAHWAELACYPDIPLDPEWDLYQSIAAAGMLAIYTCRIDSVLVGYSVFFLRRGHMHYRNSGWAMNDIVWIHPDHRNLGLGRAFVAFWDADLRASGIDVVHVDSKVAAPALGHLLSACGYTNITLGFERRLA